MPNVLARRTEAVPARPERRLIFDITNEPREQIGRMKIDAVDARKVLNRGSFQREIRVAKDRPRAFVVVTVVECMANGHMGIPARAVDQPHDGVVLDLTINLNFTELRLIVDGEMNAEFRA